MEAILLVQKCLNLSNSASFLEVLRENIQRKLRSSTPSLNMFSKSENAEDGHNFQCEKCLKLSIFASICFILCKRIVKKIADANIWLIHVDQQEI